MKGLQMTVKQANIHSNAFNFEEFLAGGVDPRTGMYGCALTLGEITSGSANGPSLPIGLFYSPLQGGDSGFGKGWSMSLTSYDVASGMFQLSGGGRYKARQTSTRLVFDELKLETLKVLRPSPGIFEIVHKSGLREELKVYPGSDVALPTKIVAANGAAMMLDYTAINGEPVLSTVRDASRTLLSISRTSGQISLDLYPGTECATTFTLKLTNDEVRSIHLPEGGIWSLIYEQVAGLDCLTQVNSPLGARELISYQDDGHRFPPDGPVQALPYVISHTLFPGQKQPAIITNYTFSEANFLGFKDNDIRWSREGDTLYQSSSNYQYSSIETMMDGAKVHRSIKRTYNQYHLLVSQVTTCNQSVTSQSIEYHLEPGKRFDQQPAQFGMPKVQIQRYENRKTRASLEETTTTEFDASGNLLKHVAPSGVVTLAEFYPAGGGEGCPADPLGFVRFEKQRTVQPATGFADAATLVLRLRYEMLGEVGAPGCDVVLAQQALYERTANGDILRSQTHLDYIDSATDAQRHGLLKTQTISQNGQASATKFQYTLNDSTLDVQAVQVGFDDTRRTSITRFSAINGYKLSEQDEDKGNVVFTYDRLGRVLSEKVAPGSAFEATSSTHYEQAKASGAAAMTLGRDVNGVQKKSYYDGLGRVIAIEDQDVDQSAEGEFRQVYAAKYDRLGQMTGEAVTDWWPGQKRVLITGFVFDDWGQVKTTIHPDGRHEHRDFDPVSRRERTWQEGMGKTVTQYNAFGKPDHVEQFDTADQSQGKRVYEYDGLGRSVVQTDPLGNRTAYEYDVFNRLTQSILPDGNRVQTKYADHSHESLPIEITMAGRTLGKQQFDGLGRLIQSTCGGRMTLAGYEAGFSLPAWNKRPGGEQIKFQYERNLGRLKQRQATGLQASYDYHPRHGKLINCVEGNRETRLEYYPSGRLKRETSKFAEEKGKSVSYTHSMGGRPLTCTDVLGEEHKTDYDDAGRPRSFEQRLLKATFAYNALGQLETIDTQAAEGQGSLVTRLAYDDLGREVSRTFEAGGGITRVLSSSYTLAGKLAQKTVWQGEEVLRSELFAYDSRGRLSEYSCRGTQRPLDAQGNEIIRQTYVFDAFDNILTLQTDFPGGTNVASFEYSPNDPTQLTGIRNSHADYPAPVVLRYDDNGHLIQDEQQRRLAYDALGRLTEVASAVGSVIRSYQYDARDQLVEMSQPTGIATQRFYRGSRVINETCGTDTCTLLRPTGILLGQERKGADAAIHLLGVDQQQSVLMEVAGQQSRHFAYSPYGHRPAEGGLFSLLGFNGEQLDRLTGLYLLGNGYRAYSPGLMRFLSPDSMSPFGAGGLNPYAYCGGDPINRVDPTGHAWQDLVGIGLSILGFVITVATMGAATPLAIASMTLAFVSMGLGVAAGVIEHLDPGSEVAEILGWASLAVGVASAASGLRVAGLRAVDKGLIGKPGATSVQYYMPTKAKAAKPPSIIKGKGAKKAAKAQNAEASAERVAPKKWTRTGMGDESVADAMADTAKNNWGKFRDGLDAGLHPKEAAGLLDDPKFKQFGSTNQWQIRISQSERVTFAIFKDNREVRIMGIGGHT
ncbi:RHS repeat domain-containing protein [Pseudomonas sp. MDT1-17]